jgi:hypothetical protein
VHLFLGPHHAKLPRPLVLAMHVFGERGRCIELDAPVRAGHVAIAGEKDTYQLPSQISFANGTSQIKRRRRRHRGHEPLSLVGGHRRGARRVHRISVGGKHRGLGPIGDTATASQACPIGNAPMQLRKVSRGCVAGQAFWGCSRFPARRGTRPA